MPTIGSDCHIWLSHPNVNGGAAYGFLVDEDNNGSRPGGVQITREVSSDGSALIYVQFDVLMANNAVNPNGSPHTKTRLDDYFMLLEYLAQLSAINIATPVGVFLNLFAVGFTADERHLPKSSLVKCQLNNVGIFWPPVSAPTLSLCVWDGAFAWRDGYWR